MSSAESRAHALAACMSSDAAEVVAPGLTAGALSLIVMEAEQLDALKEALVFCATHWLDIEFEGFTMSLTGYPERRHEFTGETIVSEIIKAVAEARPIEIAEAARC